MFTKLLPRNRRNSRSHDLRYLTLCALLATISILYLKCEYNCDSSNKSSPVVAAVDKNLPIIFIGGIPRSGTTLMRVMLDAHPLIRCGEETHVLPRLVNLRNEWRGESEVRRLDNAGLSQELIDTAVVSFMLQVIVKHDAPAQHFCNKDPFLLKTTNYLSSILPNSKFILMIRDARATVHSIISRKIVITEFNTADYREALRKWNENMESMYNQCVSVGSKRCLPVFYEQLVLKPEKEMRKILRFLDIEWNDAVLHHEKYIDSKIKISPDARSSDQVRKAINFDSLMKWVDGIPKEVLSEVDKLAPMMVKLGYNIHQIPPQYSRETGKDKRSNKV